MPVEKVPAERVPAEPVAVEPVATQPVAVDKVAVDRVGVGKVVVEPVVVEPFAAEQFAGTAAIEPAADDAPAALGGCFLSGTGTTGPVSHRALSADANGSPLIPVADGWWPGHRATWEPSPDRSTLLTMVGRGCRAGRRERPAGTVVRASPSCCGWRGSSAGILDRLGERGPAAPGPPGART